MVIKRQMICKYKPIKFRESVQVFIGGKECGSEGKELGKGNNFFIKKKISGEIFGISD